MIRLWRQKHRTRIPVEQHGGSSNWQNFSKNSSNI